MNPDLKTAIVLKCTRKRRKNLPPPPPHPPHSFYADMNFAHIIPNI